VNGNGRTTEMIAATMDDAQEHTVTLAEGLSIAREVLRRPLTDDEILIVGRLIDAGRGTADILKTFDNYERPPEVDDDGVGIHRYELGVDEHGPKAVEF
jgi:hypothetical protein